MKEYDKIADITRRFLTGDLYKLTMEFVSQDNLRVSISYEDDLNELIEYNFEIHPSTGITDFLGHQCRKALYHYNIDRDSNFEHAICDMLCL